MKDTIAIIVCILLVLATLLFVGCAYACWWVMFGWWQGSNAGPRLRGIDHHAGGKSSRFERLLTRRR
jgi:hypothetical protein